PPPPPPPPPPQKPVIESISQSTTVLKETSLSLIVVAKSTDGGELSYQWYSASSADSEGEKIAGATSASYSFISLSKANYYYVIVTNTKDGKSAEIKSSIITVSITEKAEEVSLPKTPVVTKQPEQTIKALKNGEVTLSVSASSPDGGALSYQWYRAADASANGTAISSETAASCTIKADSEAYYYAIVMNTKDGQTASVASNRTHIVITDNPAEVVPPKAPVISVQPVGGTVKKGGTYMFSVTASVTDSGALSYQWYRVEDASVEGVALDGATAAEYALKADNASAEAYYYVIVTNTLNGRTESVKSAVVKIEFERISVTVDAGGGSFADGKNMATISIIPGESLADIIKKIGIPTITKDGETLFADYFLDKESADDPDFNEWTFDYAGLLWESIEKAATFVAQYDNINYHYIEFYDKDAEDPQNAWNLLFKNLKETDDGYSVILPITERGEKFRITSKWCTFFYGDGTTPATLKAGESTVLKPVLHNGDDTVGGTIDAVPGVYKLSIVVQSDGSLKAELNAVPNEPYAGDYVYIVGGITESTLESDEVTVKDATSIYATAWEVPVSNGAFSFEFTYNGNDGWGDKYGEHAFTIMSDLDNGWNPEFRWGNAVVSVGSEETLLTYSSYDNVENIEINHLAEGVKYKASGTLSSLGGTLSVTTKGKILPDMNLVFDGQESVQMTQTSASKFEYDIPTSPSAETIQFCVNYGDKWWGEQYQLTVRKEIELSVSKTKPASNMTFNCEANAKYTIYIVYDDTTEKLSVTVTGGRFVNTAAVCGSFEESGWNPCWLKPIDEKTGYFDFVAVDTTEEENLEYEFKIQEEAGIWDKQYNGSLSNTIVAVGKNETPTPVQLTYVTTAYFDGNAKITGCVPGITYRMTVTVVDADNHIITVTVQALE
ncbi:MAG: hypothetical protein K2M99_02235, partial [Treponemataceae bacterium]|nr:hypothetical protein [Treponemataceae bacterium]